MTASTEPAAARPPLLERALVGYARHFPLEKGKLRVVDTLWRSVAGRDLHRTAQLIHGGFHAPCQLSNLLQRQMYFFGTYFLERHLLSLWGDIAREAQVVMDVGANAGIYSLAAMAANPKVTVFAFEPTPEIAERLRATAQLNGLSSLHVEEVAVAATVGRAGLIRYRGEHGDNDGMNYVVGEGEGSEAESVPTTSIAAFAAHHGLERIDLLKLDIQGGEHQALLGARELLARHRIGHVVLELNWGTDAQACPATNAVKLLADAGYCFAAPQRPLVWREAGEWLRSCSDAIAGPAPDMLS